MNSLTNELFNAIIKFVKCSEKEEYAPALKREKCPRLRDGSKKAVQKVALEQDT